MEKTAADPPAVCPSMADFAGARSLNKWNEAGGFTKAKFSSGFELL